MIIRPYQKGDESSILNLFTQCYGKEMKESFWQWRFMKNPLRKTFILLAWDGEVLVSHYAVSPVIVTFKKNDYLTGLSMTTMTHEKYRGLKLFSKLAKLVYEQMEISKYSMVWGFPNDKSNKTFIKDLQWVHVCEIPTMQLMVDTDVKINYYDIVTDDQFELDYVDILYSSEFLHVRKEKRYLKWRYAQNPLNQYTNLVIMNNQRVSSFCVVKKYFNSLDIVDFQATNAEEGGCLLEQAIFFAYYNKLGLINCWAPRYHFFHLLCEKVGFQKKELMTHFGFLQLSGADSMQFSNDFSDWYIQMGDSDVY